MPYTLLPGRIAILVSEKREDTILVPHHVRQKWIQFGLIKRNGIQYVACRGKVAAVPPSVYPPMDAHQMPAVGTEVIVSEKYGLIIDHNDMDIPSIGAEVPEGYTLRIFGVGDPWHEHVYSAVESDTVTLPGTKLALV